ncbi:MAG: PIN domain-containing protein [Candidatus Diapherotrites archaeon]|nr:PIN domain-containing protein [Candidatus Diapherotrites archaeon]
MIEKNFIERELVDSNLLIYLITGEDQNKMQKVKEFLISKPYLNVSLQTLRELSNILLNKYSFDKTNTIDHLNDVKSSMLVIFDNYEDILRATEIFKEHKVPFWDALLISTSERNGITTIYTENTKDFAKFPRIKIINPLK